MVSKKSTFTAVQYTRTPKEQAQAKYTFREAINESITAINKGLTFKGDMPSAGTNGTQNTPHYLGSTLSIVRLDMNQAGSSATPTPAGTSSQPNIAEFKGDNLITRYTNESGNAKIEIGFKNAPMFEKVTLSQKQMYENGTGSGSGASGSTVGENDLITKGYLEQALNKFKFKVENGSGKPIEIGRGDTLKFTNGQNIQVTVKDGNDSTTQASAGMSSASAVASAPLQHQLLQHQHHQQLQAVHQVVQVQTAVVQIVWLRQVVQMVQAWLRQRQQVHQLPLPQQRQW
ncbi:hypothetical protein V4937_02555 [Histophilus somni]